MAHLISSLHLRLRRPRALAVFLVFAAAVAGLGVGGRSAFSQVGNPNELVFPTRPKQNVPPPPPGDAPMLVEANEVKYDYSNNIVSAVGNVQIYYKGSTIEADQVIYDQKQSACEPKAMLGSRSRTAISLTGRLSILPTIIATDLSIRCDWKCQTIPAWRRCVPTAAKAITRS